MSSNYFIIDQINPHTGEFDEHKLVKGANLSMVDAALVYLSNYEPNWQGLGAISEVTPHVFDLWLHYGNRKEPFSNSRFADDTVSLSSAMVGDAAPNPSKSRHWITVKGSHILVNGNGDVVGGAGGKLAGRKFSVPSGSKDVSKHIETVEKIAQAGYEKHGGDKSEYLRMGRNKGSSAYFAREYEKTGNIPVGHLRDAVSGDEKTKSALELSAKATTAQQHKEAQKAVTEARGSHKLGSEEDNALADLAMEHGKHHRELSLSEAREKIANISKASREKADRVGAAVPVHPKIIQAESKLKEARNTLETMKGNGSSQDKIEFMGNRVNDYESDLKDTHEAMANNQGQVKGTPEQQQASRQWLDSNGNNPDWMHVKPSTPITTPSQPTPKPDAPLDETEYSKKVAKNKFDRIKELEKTVSEREDRELIPDFSGNRKTRQYALNRGVGEVNKFHSDKKELSDLLAWKESYEKGLVSATGLIVKKPAKSENKKPSLLNINDSDAIRMTSKEYRELGKHFTGELNGRYSVMSGSGLKYVFLTDKKEADNSELSAQPLSTSAVPSEQQSDLIKEAERLLSSGVVDKLRASILKAAMKKAENGDDEELSSVIDTVKSMASAKAEQAEKDAVIHAENVKYHAENVSTDEVNKIISNLKNTKEREAQQFVDNFYSQDISKNKSIMEGIGNTEISSNLLQTIYWEEVLSAKKEMDAEKEAKRAINRNKPSSSQAKSFSDIVNGKVNRRDDFAETPLTKDQKRVMHWDNAARVEKTIEGKRDQAKFKKFVNSASKKFGDENILGVRKNGVVEVDGGNNDAQLWAYSHDSDRFYQLEDSSIKKSETQIGRQLNSEQPSPRAI